MDEPVRGDRRDLRPLNAPILEGSAGLPMALVCAAALLPSEFERLLDIGCGDGAFGSLVRRRREAQLHGVEFIPAAAERARSHYDAVHCLDLEAESPDWPAGPFDVITALDVLEHLVQPALLLQRLTRLLRPGGWFICSMPNVLHQSVLFSLLRLRRWGDQGIMDPSHLRFFTLQTLVSLLQGAGLEVDARMLATATPANQELSVLGEAVTAIGGNGAQLAWEAEVVQYQLRARFTGAEPRPMQGVNLIKMPNVTGMDLDQALALTEQLAVRLA